MQTCRAVVVQTREACGKPADHVVTFSDGDKVTVCQACALQLQQTAGAHGTRIKVEKAA